MSPRTSRFVSRLGAVEDAARCAHVVVRDRAHDVGQREARRLRLLRIDRHLNRRRDGAVLLHERDADDLLERRHDLVDDERREIADAQRLASAGPARRRPLRWDCRSRSAAFARRWAASAARSARVPGPAPGRRSDSSSVGRPRRSKLVRAESTSRDDRGSARRRADLRAGARSRRASRWSTRPDS